MIQIQRGDYVRTIAIANEEQYHEIAKKFVEAQSAPGEYPRSQYYLDFEYDRDWAFGLDKDGENYHGVISDFMGRELTPEEVLNSSTVKGTVRMTLKPGNVVKTENLTEEQYIKVAEAFIEAGAKKGEYGNHDHNWSHWRYFGWCSIDGLYHSQYHDDNRYDCETHDLKVLSFDQIIGPVVWKGMQDGLPPVGTVCRHVSREVLIVAHEQDEDGEPYAVFRGVHNKNYNWAYRAFFPIKTEEELVVEALAALIHVTEPAEYSARLIYDKGYRLAVNG